MITTMKKSFEDIFFTPMDQSFNLGLDMFQYSNQNDLNAKSQLTSTASNDNDNHYYTTVNPQQNDLNVTDFENDEASMENDQSIFVDETKAFKNFIEQNQMNDDNNGKTSNISSETSMEYDIKFDPFLNNNFYQDPKPEAYFPEQEELNDYTLIKQIGEGAFAKVFKAIPKRRGNKSFLLNNYQEVAIKIARKELNNDKKNDGLYCPRHKRYHTHRHKHMEKYYKDVPKKKKLKTTKWEEIQAEIAIHRVVSNGSPHVVNFIDFQESSSYYFIVLEKVNGGEIFDQVIKYTYFSEDLTRHIIYQLAQAVKHLHQVGVVHRDIKLENILFEPINHIPSDLPRYRRSDNRQTKLDEGRFVKGKGGAGIGLVKLTDFGLSKRIFTDNTTTPCGTLGYTAPEVICQDNYSMKVDLWGIGCVLYTLLCGFPPFYEEDANKLRANICEGRYTFLEPWWCEISQGAKTLVTKLLEVDPKKRYDIDDLLNDPWLNNYDCDIVNDTEFYFNNNDNNLINITSSTPYADTSSDRSTLIHSAFTQSNNIQRTREAKRNHLLGTGFINTPKKPLSNIIQQERFTPKNPNFSLNLNSATLLKRRGFKNTKLKEKFDPFAKYTQKQNNSHCNNNTISNNINNTRVTF